MFEFLKSILGFNRWQAKKQSSSSIIPILKSILKKIPEPKKTQKAIAFWSRVQRRRNRERIAILTRASQRSMA